MSTKTPMSPDWVFSNNSNVSVAKDRGWFTSYTPFKSHLNSLMGGTETAVEGIGTVEIPVKLQSRRKGKKHGILRIDHVLHAPTLVCNVLGRGDFMNRYRVITGWGEGMSSSSIKDSEGNAVAFFDEKKTFFCLKLSGPPVGPVTTPSLFLKSNASMDYYIIAVWSLSERVRWQALKPYAAFEKAWLKHHYKSEYHFLREQGLSIYKNEDREEGRGIARAIMAADLDDEEDTNGFLDDVENEATFHLARLALL